MNEPEPAGSHEPKDRADFREQVGAKVKRKLKAKRSSNQDVWFGLGMMGLIGWSVVVPTLLGAAIGSWLDRNHAGSHSWTLTLLVAGLVIGCWSAWQWVAKEDKAMRDEQEDDNDE
jgi:ATP synthase protein I